jgi:hypothetical protein
MAENPLVSPMVAGPTLSFPSENHFASPGASPKLGTFLKFHGSMARR